MKTGTQYLSKDYLTVNNSKRKNGFAVFAILERNRKSLKIFGQQYISYERLS